MEASGDVTFPAPVFRGVSCRRPRLVRTCVESLTGQAAATQAAGNVSFSCASTPNCLCASPGRTRTGSFVGPLTCGEAAHQLLNQTLVPAAVAKVSTGWNHAGRTAVATTGGSP